MNLFYAEKLLMLAKMGVKVVNESCDRLRQEGASRSRTCCQINWMPSATLRPALHPAGRRATTKQTIAQLAQPLRDELMLSAPPCALVIFSTLLYFHTVCTRGSQGAGGTCAGRGAGRVARPLAFSTALSRSVGRSASQSTTLVFFVYFLFYSFICHSDLTAAQIWDVTP